MERTRLIFINGAPGTGKSAVSRAVQKMLPDCALLDGDDVWNLRPFRVTEKSKELAFANMSAVLKNYLASGLARNVVFCWVMHERRIAEELLRRIGHTGGLSLFTLTCEEEELKRRILEGERSGARRKGGLALALERARQVRENFPQAADTAGKTPQTCAREIADILFSSDAEIRYFSDLPPDAKMIREEVFVREQGFLSEFDGKDGEAAHAVLYYRGEPAGTCRFFADGDAVRVGRFALLPPFRGCGLGLFLLNGTLREIRARGGKRAVLDAQARAAGFYEKAGFCTCGEPFDEEGCPHIRMEKDLTDHAERTH